MSRKEFYPIETKNAQGPHIQSFQAWLEEVARIFAVMEVKTGHLDEVAWRELYDADLTPAQAVTEDLSHAY